MTTKIVNNEDHPTEIYPRNTRNTAVRVRGVRGVPKSYTVPEPVLPVLETPRVLPYPCGTLLSPYLDLLNRSFRIPLLIKPLLHILIYLK